MEQALALGQENPVDRGFEETTGTLGLPLQGDSLNKKVAQAHEQCNFLKNKKVAI